MGDRTWLALGYELRELARSAVPHPVVRWLIVGLAGIGLALGIVLALRGPGAASVDALAHVAAGLALTSGLYAFGAALLSVGELLRRPERARLLLIAPLAPGWAVALRALPTPVLVGIPLLALYVPVLGTSLRAAPASALLFAAIGILVIAWSSVLAFAAGAALARISGRERAATIARASAIALAGTTTAVFAPALRTAAPPLPPLPLLAACALTLPLVATVGGRAFGAVMVAREPERVAAEPVWGRASWWRMLGRTRSVWLGASLVPSLALVLFADHGWRQGVTAAMLVTAATLPHVELLRAESERPERWRIAPEGDAVRRTAVRDIGIPTVLLVLAAAAALSGGSWTWLAATAALVVLVTVMFALEGARIRGALFLFALAASFATQWLP